MRKTISMWDVDEILSVLIDAGCGEEESREILEGREGVVDCEKARVRYEWDPDNEEVTLEIIPKNELVVRTKPSSSR